MYSVLPVSPAPPLSSPATSLAGSCLALLAIGTLLSSTLSEDNFFGFLDPWCLSYLDPCGLESNYNLILEHHLPIRSNRMMYTYHSQYVRINCTVEPAADTLRPTDFGEMLL